MSDTENKKDVSGNENKKPEINTMHVIDLNDSNDHFDEIYQEVEKYAEQFQLNQDNVVTLLVKTMEMADKLSIPSLEKQELVEGIVEKLLTQMGVSNEDVNNYHLVLDKMIPTIVAASRGKVEVTLSEKEKKKSRGVGRPRSTVTEMAECVENLYEQLIVLIKKRKINANNIATSLITLVAPLMEIVNKFPKLTGAEKKQVVIQTLKKFANNLNSLFPKINPTHQKIVSTVMNNLPDMIDTIVDASKGKFDLNKIVAVHGKTCVSLVKLIISACKGKK